MSGTLGVNTTPSYTVEFLLAGLESVLSASTAAWSASVKGRDTLVAVGDEIKNFDHGKFTRDVSRALGVKINPSFTVQYFKAELGSSLSIYSSLPV